MCMYVCRLLEDEYKTCSKYIRYSIFGLMKQAVFREMMAAHRESTRLIWSPDVQHCNYFNRVLQNGF